MYRPNSMNSGVARRGLWNLWAFTPFIVIGLAMIPNAIKIVMAQSTPAHSVESRPWEASKSFDDQRLALTRFGEEGLELHPEFHTDGTMLLRLRGGDDFDYGRLGATTIHCYRPDDPSMDRILNFRAGETVLDVSALPRGAWVLTLSGQLDGLDLRHSLRIKRPSPSGS